MSSPPGPCTPTMRDTCGKAGAGARARSRGKQMGVGGAPQLAALPSCLAEVPASSIAVAGRAGAAMRRQRPAPMTDVSRPAPG